MPPRRGRRLLPAVAGGFAVAIVALLVHGAPASARTHHASDGSAGRPKTSPSGLLGLQVGGDLGITLDVGPLHVDTTKLLGGGAHTAASGHAPHSSSPPPSPTPPRHTGGTSGVPVPPAHPGHGSRPAHSSPPHRVAPAPQPSSITAVVRTVTHRTTQHRPVTHRRHVRSRRHTPTATRQPAQHHRRRTVASAIFDPVRPGSPAQILVILVAMCGVGTALVVSLARRREPKSVRVEASERRH